MGTLDYMAPEQGGDSHIVDPRADVYSLGATLYKLLTGHVIYHGPQYQSAVQKMTALALEAAPSIRSQRSDVPPQLAEIVDKMIAKHPGDRIGSAAEVARLLAPLAKRANLAALLRQGLGVAARPGEAKSSSQVTKNEDVPSLRDTADMARGKVPADVPLPVAAARPRPARPLRVAQPLPPPIVPPPVSTTQRARAAAPGGAPFWIYPLAAGVLTLVALVAVVALIKINTPYGEVLVELGEGVQADDVQIEVRRDGELSIIDAEKNWTIDIREGRYEASLAGGGDRMKLEPQTITVRRKKQTRLRVSLEPRIARAEPRPAVPVAQPTTPPREHPPAVADIEPATPRADEPTAPVDDEPVVPNVEQPTSAPQPEVVGDDAEPLPAGESQNEPATSETARPAGLAFDGRSSRLELPPLPLDTSGPLTIEALVDLESPAGEAIIASNLSAAGGFRFSINQDGWWSFKWAQGRALLGRGGPGKKEGPLHTAAVWDGKDVKVFVDGRSVIAGGGAIPLTDVPTKAVPLMIGAEAGPDLKPRKHLAGVLTQLRLSKTARYTDAFDAPAALTADADTLALYNADLSGRTLRDASPHKRHGRAFALKVVDDSTP
jgi:hypothetical protein